MHALQCKDTTPNTHTLKPHILVIFQRTRERGSKPLLFASFKIHSYTLEKSVSQEILGTKYGLTHSGMKCF